MSTFFQAIYPLMKGNKSMKVLLTPSGDDEISISFIPVPVDAIKGDSAAPLLKPFSLTGTPIELDEAFFGEMQKYAGARHSLQAQVEAEISIMDEAKKTSATKTTKALTGKGGKTAPVAKTPVVGGGDVEDDEGGDNTGTGDSPAAGAAAPAPAAQPGIPNLFTA